MEEKQTFYTVKLGKLYVVVDDKLDTAYFGTLNIQKAKWSEDLKPAEYVAKESGGKVVKVEVITTIT